MSKFEVSRDDLLQLSDERLEELIARLAEAEVASHGLSPSCVHWSGSINSPDGGVDMRADAGIPKAVSDFIKRANTVFQVKKHGMPAGKIADAFAFRFRAHGAEPGDRSRRDPPGLRALP